LLDRASDIVQAKKHFETAHREVQKECLEFFENFLKAPLLEKHIFAFFSKIFHVKVPFSKFIRSIAVF